MITTCSCPVIEGVVVHGMYEACPWEENPGGPEIDDTEAQCAAEGHRYVGDDEGLGRCYCGARCYPAGGPTKAGGL